MKFLIDHNLSPSLARAINEVVQVEFKDTVTPLRDKFHNSTSDEDWLLSLASEGDWCFISADYRISRSTIERAAFRKSGLTGFFLSKGLRKKPLSIQTARLLMQWNLISSQAKMISGAALFEILERGSRLKQLPF